MLSLRPKAKSHVDQIGLIGKFLSNAVPAKWIALTQDRYLEPAQYSALFAKVGYRFGKDAQNRFFLPKLDNTTGGLGYFLKVMGSGETNGQLIATPERPKHQHSRSTTLDGDHSHTLPTDRYLRSSPNSGRKNANGTGTPYSEPTKMTHSSHSHSDSASGLTTGLNLSNKGSVSAPPAVEVIMAIYAGV